MATSTQACRIRRLNERLEKYRITKLIGSGGAARTYEAYHRESGQRVALKTLPPESCKDERIVEGFVLEARLAAELSHPNLAACLDVDLEANPPWIAFELVEGASLSDVIRQNDFLDPCWASNLILDIAYGLAAAHQKQVLHRDVKPSNILFSANGRVKLIDFGAAWVGGRKEQGSGSSAGDCETQQSGFTGTLLYSSPEQLKGEDLDERSDLFSLALVFYELLTGKRLLSVNDRGSEMDVFMDVFSQQANLEAKMVPPSSLRPGIPQKLDELLQGMLSFQSRKRRPASAIELIEALSEIMEEEDWHSSQRESQRLLAHHELAEVAYWRAKSCLEEDRFGQAVSLLDSLTKHPQEVTQSYRESIKRGMYQVFANQCLCHIKKSPGLGQLLDWLTAFKKMSAMSKRIDDPDMQVLAERRFLTVSDWLEDREDRREALCRYVEDNPSSVAATLRALEMSRECLELVEQEDLDELQSCLLRACIDEGWYSKALELVSVDTSSSPHGDDEEGSSLEQRIREVLEAWQLFDNVRKHLKRRGQTRGLVQLCHRFLEEHPGNEDAWRELAHAYARMGLKVESAHAQFELGRLCLRRDLLEEGRQAFIATLEILPSHEGAFNYLFEILYAQGHLPTTFDDSTKLRVGILCKERLVKSVRNVLLDTAKGAIDRDFLSQLLSSAMSWGDSEMAAEIDFHLGRFCLYEGDYDSGMEHFLSSLESSKKPGDMLRQMEELSEIRKVFTPLELLSLRRDLTRLEEKKN